MLKQQTIPVGDIDTIANAIDKQKVSFMWRGGNCMPFSTVTNFPAHNFSLSQKRLFRFSWVKTRTAGKCLWFSSRRLPTSTEEREKWFSQRAFSSAGYWLWTYEMETWTDDFKGLPSWHFHPFPKNQLYHCLNGIDGEDRKIIDFYLNSTLSLENFTIDGNNIMARVGFWTQSSSNIDVDIILDQTTLLTGP